MKHFILSVGMLLLSYASSAQQTLSLQEAISIALQNNYDIKLVKNDVEIASNNVNLGNAGILPSASGNFSSGGSRQNSVQTQSTGTQRINDGIKSTNMSYGVGLDWTIFDGFKMFATLDKLKTLEQQGQINLKTQISTTVSDVVSAYYNVAKQQQVVNAADSAIEISNLRLRIANNKLEIGRGSKLDLLAAKVDYNTDTSNFLQQRNLLANYQVNLNQLLARDVNTKFVVPNAMPIDNNLNYSELAKQTDALNPELQYVLLNKKIAMLSLKEIKAGRYPRIGLNTAYEFNRSTTPTGFNTNYRSNGLSYGVTANINMFNGFLQRQNERNAKIIINSSDLTINKLRQDLNAQLTTAYQTYSTYIGLVKLEEGNVAIANQNLGITLEKYRLGSIAPLELREAQRNALNASTRYLEVKYQTKLAEITLKEISGTLNIQ